mmetsp:Transcript_18954/g.56840  ORF Transcript_18954/g.56840 Transcript_18954/m.56840 type:complete len:269 (-) Transcript_18954:1075-1881(-)
MCTSGRPHSFQEGAQSAGMSSPSSSDSSVSSSSSPSTSTCMSSSLSASSNSSPSSISSSSSSMSEPSHDSCRLRRLRLCASAAIICRTRTEACGCVSSSGSPSVPIAWRRPSGRSSKSTLPAPRSIATLLEEPSSSTSAARPGGGALGPLSGVESRDLTPPPHEDAVVEKPPSSECSGSHSMLSPWDSRTASPLALWTMASDLQLSPPIAAVGVVDTAGLSALLACILASNHHFGHHGKMCFTHTSVGMQGALESHGRESSAMTTVFR